MSQRNRLAIAALALSAALVLASPAPCHAAGLGPERITAAGLLERFLGWLHELWPGAVSDRPDVAWEKEGAMINPNGQPGAATAPSTPAAQGDSQ
jgi:hypothetical protein